MTVSRKLFLTIAAFIILMGVLFALLTQFVVQGVIQEFVQVDRAQEIEGISSELIAYYAHHQSWESVQSVDIGQWMTRANAGVLLISTDKQLLHKGEADAAVIQRLGKKSNVWYDGKKVARLYYYDPEVANSSIVRVGINSSVTFLLSAGAVLLVLLALIVAYRQSERLTAPLGELVVAIDRLDQGERGVQTAAAVGAKDEYGKVAESFNRFSAQLKLTEEARRKLVADVAHELRTPLTIIRGKLELLQQDNQMVEPQSLLPLHDEVIRLTRLVDDLHQLSLAEARQLTLDFRPVHIAELLGRVVAYVGADAAAKNINLSFADRSGDAVIEADPHRITQVLLNILLNAIRHTPEQGEIHTTIDAEQTIADAEQNITGHADAGSYSRTNSTKCACSTSSTNRNNSINRTNGTSGNKHGSTYNGHASRRVCIRISDNGPGIDEEHLPHVFNRFYRADEARSRDRGGMGLGLAIAKEFVLAHGGTIDIASKKGKGTKVVIRL